jgi:hypothetical protein
VSFTTTTLPSSPPPQNNSTFTETPTPVKTRPGIAAVPIAVTPTFATASALAFIPAVAVMAARTGALTSLLTGDCSSLGDDSEAPQLMDSPLQLAVFGQNYVAGTPIGNFALTAAATTLAGLLGMFTSRNDKVVVRAVSACVNRDGSPRRWWLSLRLVVARMGMHGHASSVLNTFVLMLVTPSTSAALVAVQRWWDGTTVEEPGAAAAVAVAATAVQALAGGVGLCVALRRRRELFRCIHLPDEAVVAAVSRQHRHAVVKFIMFLWFALSQLVHEPWHWRLRHHLFVRGGAVAQAVAAPAEATHTQPRRQADHDDLNAACHTAELLTSDVTMSDSFSLHVTGHAPLSDGDAFAVLRRVAAAQTLLPFVSEYKPAVAWFFVVEFAAQLLFAVASIAASLLEYSFPNPASRAPCLGQAIITAAVFGVYALLVVGLRPVLAPLMQHLTALVAVVQFAAAIVGVCVSLKVVTSQAIIVVAVYAMTIAQMLPIGFFLIPWLWRSGRAVHDVLKHASAEDLLSRLQNMQVHGRHRERERLAKAIARAKAKAAKAKTLPHQPLLEEASGTAASPDPPTAADGGSADELEAALLGDGGVINACDFVPAATSGGGGADAGDGDLLLTAAPALIGNPAPSISNLAAGSSSAGVSAGGVPSRTPGCRSVFDQSSDPAATATRAHVSSTSWENAYGRRGSGGEYDLHRAFATAARARMSSRNPLARSAGGNLVGDVVLPADDGDLADAAASGTALGTAPGRTEREEEEEEEDALIQSDVDLDPALTLLLSLSP